MTEKEYQLRIHELEKQVERLQSEIKRNSETDYGLRWMDIPEAFEKESENKIPTLEEVKELAISHDDGKPTHILIEGDNYHALTCLNYTHKGKIDVIYIDPPYNTGSDGFVYKDKRVLDKFPDGTTVPIDHPLRHSYWLSFMEKRLQLAKNLLSENGVIFISIDDNEQANLKLLCDQIFGGKNFLGNIIWEKADSPRMDAKDLSSRHDFIIVYCKNIDNHPIKKIVSNAVPEHYNKVDSNGARYYLKPLRYMGNADSRSDRPNMYYGIESPDGTIVFPLRADGSDGRWRWSKEKLEKEKYRLEFIKTKNGWSVNSRIYANEGQETPVETIWFNQDVESNRQAIATLKGIFGDEKVFTNPKPVKLLQRIIQISTNEESIVLDFFAGSGTSMQATMQQNTEDGGHRQCILVQAPEASICREVTYERNRRVMQGYTNAKGETIAGLGNSMKYYRTTFIGEHTPIEASDYDKTILAQKAGCLLALSENTLEEITTTRSYQVFALRKGDRPTNDCMFTAVYFSGNLMDFAQLRKQIEHLQVEYKHPKIVIYVFCWGDASIMQNEFDDLKNLIIKDIPQPIIDIYTKLNV